MARALAIAFLIVFIGAHVADRSGDAFNRQLSDFRYVDPTWVGYLMFALLIALAAEVGRTAWRLRDRTQFAIYIFVALALTVTALTESNSPFHHLSVDALMLVLLGNYAWLLDQCDMPYCLTANLSIPLLLVLAIAVTREPGFLFKTLDLYFMIAVIIHYHAMEKSISHAGTAPTLPAPAPAPDTPFSPG